MSDFSLYALGAGVLGGFCFGLLGYAEAKLNEDKNQPVKFDAGWFALSMIPAVIAGVFAGFGTTDIPMAFMGGMSGKAVFEKLKNLS